MPSSMPMPARSTGTTSGTGLAILTPAASATGVRTVTGRAGARALSRRAGVAGEVRPRPQAFGPPVVAAQPARRHAVEAVVQAGDRHCGREVHQPVDVLCLPVDLVQFGPKSAHTSRMICS